MDLQGRECNSTITVMLVRVHSAAESRPGIERNSVRRRQPLGAKRLIDHLARKRSSINETPSSFVLCNKLVGINFGFVASNPISTNLHPSSIIYSNGGAFFHYLSLRSKEGKLKRRFVRNRCDIVVASSFRCTIHRRKSKHTYRVSRKGIGWISKWLLFETTLFLDPPGLSVTSWRDNTLSLFVRLHGVSSERRPPFVAWANVFYSIKQTRYLVGKLVRTQRCDVGALRESREGKRYPLADIFKA